MPPQGIPRNENIQLVFHWRRNVSTLASPRIRCQFTPPKNPNTSTNVSSENKSLLKQDALNRHYTECLMEPHLFPISGIFRRYLKTILPSKKINLEIQFFRLFYSQLYPPFAIEIIEWFYSERLRDFYRCVTDWESYRE